jgi:hypothetical protein
VEYLSTTGKAEDSDKLDGVDITDSKALNSLDDPMRRVLFWDDSAGAEVSYTVDGIVGTDLEEVARILHPTWTCSHN